MSFNAIVRNVIEEADIVLEIVDSRFPDQTRNKRIESLILEKGKKLLIVMNKSDLIPIEEARKNKALAGMKSIFLSAKKRSGGIRLKEEIGKMAGNNEVKIALIGYPNTGKSTIANMLIGRRGAKTSPKAGFTRGIQKMRVNSKIMLVDTPGIIPFEEQDETLMVLLAAKNAQDVKDLQATGSDVAEILLKENPAIQEYYGVKAKDGEEFLEQIAIKRNKFMKKGKPDINTAARLLIADFQTGKIGLNK